MLPIELAGHAEPMALPVRAERTDPTLWDPYTEFRNIVSQLGRFPDSWDELITPPRTGFTPLADVEEVCSRVTILYGGKVREQGAMEQVLAQRDKTQFTAERLTAETIEAIRRLIREREGKDVLVATPRDRLESLFLRIVQQAHRDQVETHGSQMAGALAGFLGEGADGRAVLDSLVKAVESVEIL